MNYLCVFSVMVVGAVFQTTWAWSNRPDVIERSWSLTWGPTPRLQQGRGRRHGNDQTSAASSFVDLITRKLFSSRKGKTTAMAASSADPASDRIFKGYIADPHDFPWMVKLKSRFPLFHVWPLGGIERHRNCGGALITSRWILTARHCITMYDQPRWSVSGRRSGGGLRDARSVDIFVGSHGRYGDDGVPVASDRSIGRADYLVPQCNLRDPVIARQNRRDGRGCHPSNLFSRIFSLKRAPGIDTTYTNDIVLVRLQRPVATNNDVHPVRMPGTKGFNYDFVGEIGYVAGWGVTDKRRSKSGRLKAAEMEIVPAFATYGCKKQQSLGKMCVRSFEKSSLGGDVCPGDSGSPLVLWDGEAWTIVGVLSNGAQSCFQGMPSVFTRVGDYMDWVEQTVSAYSGIDYIDTNDISDKVIMLDNKSVEKPYTRKKRRKVARQPPPQQRPRP